MRRYEHGGNIYENAKIELDFSVNVNPLGMPEGAKQAIVDSIDAFVRYPDCECCALRAALAQRHGVDMERILCGNGASDLIFRICACIKPRIALTLAPTFSEYERATTLFGGHMREHLLAEENGFALTEAILPALTEDVDMLFLCNPNNPTGQLAEPPLLQAILDTCRKNGILTVLDECFIGFTNAPSMIAALEEYPNLLILNAFTKLYGMAGLRLGYLLGDPALLARIRPFGPEWNVSTAAQAAGIAALREPDWEERSRAVIIAERAYMQNALTELGLTVFSCESNYLLIKCPQPLYAPLRERGVLVRACENFTGLDARFIRIGLQTHAKNEALICAIREVLYG